MELHQPSVSEQVYPCGENHQLQTTPITIPSDYSAAFTLINSLP